MRSSPRVSFPAKLLRGRIREGNGEERSAASGYVISHRTDGNCVAAVSVRPGTCPTGACRSSGAVPLLSSYAAAMWKLSEGESRSNRSGENAKRSGRSAV